MPGAVLRTVETLNGTTNPVSYLHQSMLRPEYSTTGKWESLNVANSSVMAELVSMDSELPLYKRDSMGSASGDIPKMGMKLQLNETQLTALDNLVAQGGTKDQILAKLFQDVPKVIRGIYERNEEMFLRGISTGYALVEDTETRGPGIRLDYGYLPANKFGVTTLWSNTASRPFDDLNRVKNEAKIDGNRIIKFLIDPATFNNIAKTTQAKELFAFYAGYVGSNVPIPSLEKVNQMSAADFGFTFQIIDRTVKAEKNGVQTVITPWAAGAVVGVCSDIVGALFHAQLAEKNRPVPGVTYEDANQYILVSKYSKNEPLAEFTASQARVFPVVTNVDQIYLIDSTTVQA